MSWICTRFFFNDQIFWDCAVPAKSVAVAVVVKVIPVMTCNGRQEYQGVQGGAASMSSKFSLFNVFHFAHLEGNFQLFSHFTLVFPQLHPDVFKCLQISPDTKHLHIFLSRHMNDQESLFLDLRRFFVPQNVKKINLVIFKFCIWEYVFIKHAQCQKTLQKGFLSQMLSSQPTSHLKWNFFSKCGKPEPR